MIPCAAELDELRKAIRGWRPGMRVEVRVEALSKVLASYAELAALHQIFEEERDKVFDEDGENHAPSR